MSTSRLRSMVASTLDFSASSAAVRSDSRRFSPDTSSRCVVDALEAAELDEQVGGGLLADAGDALDVVRRVALEADEVGDQLGADAVALADPVGRVDDDVGHATGRHHDADAVGGQLERVAVGGHHAHPVAVLVAARGERADHIVGLLARDAHVAVAEGVDDRLEERLLLAQQRRRRPAAGLVLGVELEPLRGLLVPCHDHRPRPVVHEQPHHHVGEAQEGVRRLPLGGLQLLGKREEGPVCEAVSVDQEDVAFLGRGIRQIDVGRLRLLHRGHRCSLPGAAVAGSGSDTLRLLMPPIPSASYSLTMRIEIPSTPGAFAQVAGAIAEAQGDVGAIDLVRVTRDHTVRDITVSAADSDHGSGSSTPSAGRRRDHRQRLRPHLPDAPRREDRGPQQGAGGERATTSRWPTRRASRASAWRSPTTPPRPGP